MTYLFTPPPTPSLPIQGDSRRFPVRRIFCIGRNYAEHAREMGASTNTSAAVFFLKPADTLVSDGATIPYPAATSLLHHEVEMVAALAQGGMHMAPERAADCVFGHGVGLDLTRRDLQQQAKEQGRPWDTAKGLDHGAPMSALCPIDSDAPRADTELSLHVNGEQRQVARLDTMIRSTAQIIAELSTLFELKAGDLIFTGTPAGVAALMPGDTFHARLGNLATLTGTVGEA